VPDSAPPRPEAEPSRAPRSAFTLLLFIFLISGIASLIYQVIWTRRLFLTMGATSLAISTILTAFMGGLAIGSLVAGRWIDRRGRPLIIYAALETAIGLYGAATPWLFDFIELAYQAILRRTNLPPWPSYLLRFALAMAVLIVPTGLMGATLPVLARQVTDRMGHFGRRLGLLYGINTLGAAAGVLLTGFTLISTLGLRGTAWFAAALNAFAAILALALHAALPIASPSGPDGVMPTGLQPGPEPGQDTSPLARRHRWVLALAAAGGIASFLYEIAWTRVLTLVLGGAVQAFSTMLSTFLIGLALGSVLLSRRIDKSRDLFLLFAIVEALVGITSLAILPLFGSLPWIYVRFFTSISDSTALLSAFGFVLCFGMMIVPTLLIGVTFPVIGRLYARDLSTLGRRIGEVYFANTLGGIAGSFAAGFLLIPRIGMERTLILASLLNGACAVAASLLGSSAARTRVLSAAGAIAAIALLLMAHPLAPRTDLLELPRVADAPARPPAWPDAVPGPCPRCGQEVWHPEPPPAPGAPPLHRGFCPACLPAERDWMERERRIAPRRFWDPRVITSGAHTYARHYAAHPDGRVLLSRMTDQRLVFYEEGIHAVVTVNAYVKHPQFMSLQVDGKTDASNLIDFPTEILLADLPLLLHPDPRDVLVIGLGSGITAGAATRFDEVQRVDVIEIEEAVARAALLFAESHGDVLPDPNRRPPHAGHPRLHLEIQDARHFCAVTPKRYDVVISEPSNPWMSGPSHLFTLEHFRNLRRVTKENGIAFQWIHTYSMTPELVYCLIKTFRTVFDRVLVWGYAERPGDLFLAGSSHPMRFSMERLRERMGRPGIQRDLAAINIHGPAQLLGAVVLRPDDLDKSLGLLPGRPAVAETLSRIPLNTDDYPLVEFEAPRHLHRQESSRRVSLALFGFRDEILPPIDPADENALQSLGLFAALSRANFTAGLTAAAVTAAERGLRLDPSDAGLQSLLSAILMEQWRSTKSPDLIGPIRDLNRSLVERHPRDPFPHMLLVELSMATGSYAEAVQHGEAALALGGGGPRLHHGLGVAYAGLGRDADAVAAFETALRLAPDLFDAYAALAELHERRGEWSKAMETLMRWYETESNTLKRSLVRNRYDSLRRAMEARGTKPPGSPPADPGGNR